MLLVTRGGWTLWFVRGVTAVRPHYCEFISRWPSRIAPARPKMEKFKALDRKADGSLEESPSPSDTTRRILSLINDATKYTVVLICFLSVVGLRSLPIAWSLTGSIVAAYTCKGLKYILNHSRPDGAPKADPGMPSSHATVLSFHATALCLALVWRPQAGLLRWGAATGVAMLATFLVWLRVELGFHTPAQVGVGVALGSACATVWHRTAVTWVLPACEHNPGARHAVVASFVVMFSIFLWKSVAKWSSEGRGSKRKHGVSRVA
eukprot:jgi/Botrbrau1/21752/Bobra.43_1s0146.1